MAEEGFGEVRPEVIHELRALAEQGADVPDLVDLVLLRLELAGHEALFPTLIYFRAAFLLTLREALPLREWLSGQDRAEVDSILIPAMQRTKAQWRSPELQHV